MWRTTSKIDTLQAWHEVVRSKSPGKLDQLLAEDGIFHSPVVHTPQFGKPITANYLQAALHVFGNESFRYVREVSGEYDVVLEFKVSIDDIGINGVDMIRWNDEGRITEFKAMLRPLKAVKATLIKWHNRPGIQKACRPCCVAQ